MRLSFPHPLLVWRGHVESTGSVVYSFFPVQLTTTSRIDNLITRLVYMIYSAITCDGHTYLVQHTALIDSDNLI